MDIGSIEQLVSIIRNARISELTVSTGGSRVSLRKTLGNVQVAPAAVSQETRRQPAKPDSAAKQAEAADIYITAPMVGVFHSIDDVTVGSEVRLGQTVGAIESMKLMNDVISKDEGAISEVLIEDGAPVEYGQGLFKLDRLPQAEE